MTAAIKRRYEPPSNRQRAHLELTHLQWDTVLVEAYTVQFYHLMVHAKEKWDDDIVIAMYRCDLRPQIADDAVQVAYQVEEGKREVQHKMTFSNSSPRLMSQAYGSFMSKSTSTPQPNEVC